MSEKSKTFEASMVRLEEIVRKMERGDASLAEALQLFEEGTTLVQQCNKQLDEAELTIVKLAKGADGSPVETEVANENEL